jgi:hypothetical protein
MSHFHTKIRLGIWAQNLVITSRMFWLFLVKFVPNRSKNHGISGISTAVSSRVVLLLVWTILRLQMINQNRVKPIPAKMAQLVVMMVMILLAIVSMDIMGICVKIVSLKVHNIQGEAQYHRKFFSKKIR